MVMGHLTRMLQMLEVIPQKLAMRVVVQKLVIKVVMLGPVKRAAVQKKLLRRRRPLEEKKLLKPKKPQNLKRRLLSLKSQLNLK